MSQNVSCSNMLQIIHPTMYQIKTNFSSAVPSYERCFQEFIGKKKEKKKVLTFIHLMFYFKEGLPSPKNKIILSNFLGKI